MCAQMHNLLLLNPPSFARWLGEAQVGASPGGDGRGMARFSGIQQLLQVVAINPVGRVRWDVQDNQRDDQWCDLPAGSTGRQVAERGQYGA